MRYGISNTLIEATNIKAKVASRMAYGFRNVNNLIAFLIFAYSPVKVVFPGRITHIT